MNLLKNVSSPFRTTVLNNIKLLLFVCVSATAALHLHSQKLYFSNSKLENSIYDKTEFQIIGEIKNNILIYKKSQAEKKISVYSHHMNLIREVIFTEFKENIDVIKFINNKDFIIMFFTERKKNKIILYSLVLDERANIIKDLNKIDELSTNTSNKKNSFLQPIVSSDFEIIPSKSREYFSVIKTFIPNRGRYNVIVKVFNEELTIVRSNSFDVNFSSRLDGRLNIVTTNEGHFVAVAYALDYNNVIRNGIKMYSTISFSSRATNVKTYFLDLKKDKLKSLVVDYNDFKGLMTLTGVYAKTGRKYVGFKIFEYDIKYNIFNKLYSYDVPQNILSSLKGNSKKRNILEDLQLKNIIFKKDKGLVISGEFSFFETRVINQLPNSIRRKRNLTNINNSFASNSQTNNVNQDILYYSKDIFFLSIDSTGSFQWLSTVPKFIETRDEAYTSYGLSVFDEVINVVYLQNKPLNKTSSSILPNGTVIKNKWVNKFKDFAKFIYPKKAKQISSNSYILPGKDIEGYLYFIKVAF